MKRLAFRHSLYLGLLALISCVALAAKDEFELVPITKGDILFRGLCSHCHGVKGEGSWDLKTPAIGSMPQWYVETQLEKFRNLIRGRDDSDSKGKQMAEVAHWLQDHQIKDVAHYVSELPRSPHMITMAGDLMRGRGIYKANCATCHQDDALGSRKVGSPPLSSLQDWYIYTQLMKFRMGMRGSERGDREGAQMHKVAGDLTEEQLYDVASFIPYITEEE